jgi:hypothetical protein
MEFYSVTEVEGGLHIEGFPDAVKLIKLDGPKARRVSDLLLHKRDLEFANACLEAINNVPADPSTVREALWRSAVVHFVKCFGNSAARFQLSRERIYKNDPEAMQVFEYFQHLRDKHVVHDENSYSQSIPGAILNRGDKPYKIEKILCFSAHLQTLEQNNYSNLKLLIQKALDWVNVEFDKCCDIITNDLEAIAYDDLLNKPDLIYQAPEVNRVGENRRNKT